MNMRWLRPVIRVVRRKEDSPMMMIIIEGGERKEGTALPMTFISLESCPWILSASPFSKEASSGQTHAVKHISLIPVFMWWNNCILVHLHLILHLMLFLITYSKMLLLLCKMWCKCTQNANLSCPPLLFPTACHVTWRLREDIAGSRS